MVCPYGTIDRLVCTEILVPGIVALFAIHHGRTVLFFGRESDPNPCLQRSTGYTPSDDDDDGTYGWGGGTALLLEITGTLYDIICTVPYNHGVAIIATNVIITRLGR